MLILVRHGESVANAQGLLLGRTDVELTERGRAQVTAARATRARARWPRCAPVRSARARDTAALLDLGPVPLVDDRWVEVDYGEFECQPLGDIPAEVWRRWRDDRDFRPGGRRDAGRGGRASDRGLRRRSSPRTAPARAGPTVTWSWSAT